MFNLMASGSIRSVPANLDLCDHGFCQEMHRHALNDGVGGRSQIFHPLLFREDDLRVLPSGDVNQLCIEADAVADLVEAADQYIFRLQPAPERPSPVPLSATDSPGLTTFSTSWGLTTLAPSVVS